MAAMAARQEVTQWRIEIDAAAAHAEQISTPKHAAQQHDVVLIEDDDDAAAAAEAEAVAHQPPISVERTLSTSTSSTQPGSLISSEEGDGTTPSSSTSNVAPHTPTDNTTLVPSPASLHTLSSTSFQTLHPPLASCSTASPIDQDRQAQRKLRRLCALLELVDTELSYAADLHILVRVFFAEMATLPFFTAITPATSASSSVALPDEVGARRLEAVVRNAEHLLELHTRLAAGLQSVVREAHITHSSPGQLIDKACSVHAEAAVYTIAEYWRSAAPALSSAYQYFSSQHGEALAVLREAERRTTEWTAYEKRCADLLRASTGASSTSPTERSASSSRRTSVVPSSPAMYADIPLPLASEVPSSPISATRPPLARDESSGRSARPALHIRDYLIKPVQRICLLPLMLDAISRYTQPDDPSSDELRLATLALKKATAEVDDAGRRRECLIMSRSVAARLDAAPLLEGGAANATPSSPATTVGAGSGASAWNRTQSSHLTSAVLAQLGSVALAGTLDVLHHHATLEPLTMPLRFRYYGVFVYASWILLVKVQTRRPYAFEARHWFPLWAATLDPMDARDMSSDDASRHRPSKDGLLPHSFRLSCRGHHFELAASTAAEKALWVRTLTQAVQSAALAPPTASGLTSFPNNLTHSGSGRPAGSAFWAGGSEDEEGGAGSDAASGARTPSDPLAVLEATAAAHDLETHSIALRLPAPSHRTSVDRNMLISQPLLAARNQTTTVLSFPGAQAQSSPSSPIDATAPTSASSMGLPGGANPQTWHWQRQNSVPAMLNRLGSSNTSVSVKLQRRRSFAHALDADGGDAGSAAGSSAGSPRPSPTLAPVRVTRSRANSKADKDGAPQSADENWRNTFRRRSRRTSTLLLLTPSVGAQERTLSAGATSRTPYDSPVSSAQASPVSRKDLPLPPWDAQPAAPVRPRSVRAFTRPATSSSSATLIAPRPSHERSRSSANVLVSSMRDAFDRSGSYFGKRARAQSADVVVASPEQTTDVSAEEAVPSGVPSAVPSAVSSPVETPAVPSPDAEQAPTVEDEEEEEDEQFVSVPVSPADALSPQSLPGMNPAASPVSMARTDSNSLYVDAADASPGSDNVSPPSISRASSIATAPERRRSVGGSLREVRRSLGAIGSLSRASGGWTRRGSFAESLRGAAGAGPEASGPLGSAIGLSNLLRNDSAASLPAQSTSQRLRRARSFMGIESEPAAGEAREKETYKGRTSIVELGKHWARDMPPPPPPPKDTVARRSSNATDLSPRVHLPRSASTSDTRTHTAPPPPRRTRTLTLSRLLGPGRPSSSHSSGAEASKRDAGRVGAWWSAPSGAGGARENAGDAAQMSAACALLSPVEEGGGEGNLWGSGGRKG